MQISSITITQLVGLAVLTVLIVAQAAAWARLVAQSAKITDRHDDSEDAQQPSHHSQQSGYQDAPQSDRDVD